MLLTLYGSDVAATDGPEIGPFDDLVIRAGRVVGGPAAGGRVIAFRGSDGRWLEAELEERRGVASDSPYARHSHLWLHSTERDLMVRFFAEDRDDPPVATDAELGPYTGVTVGPREIRGDGELLADRASPAGPWMRRAAVSAHDQPIGVLAVRSTSARARVVTPAEPAATQAPSAAPRAFEFVERVKVDPRIYRVAEHRDSRQD